MGVAKILPIMKLFTSFFLASLLCLNISGFAQNSNETAHINGEILFQLADNRDIDAVLNDLKVVNGAYTSAKAVELLSEHMHYWRIAFDPSAIDENIMLETCKAHPMIWSAQYNHFVEERATTPTDPDFGDQWHHVNTGQTGGTPDADIDSDDAWDITTGGLTPLGDTIVVCVVEGGGADYTHPDIAPNFWRNYNEIPGNGIDDDNNGYVDDYEGWNVGSSNDNHSAGNHGTQCMGMIGAKAQNGIGITGINWDVKMMLVSGFNTNESSVIAAYDYPLTMRKLYNSTGGSEGAFVVATSASWGIDQADPANYPLWCNFYDTLGTYGVLNVGATTNSNLDVDAVGDMPTACGSDYMISVTRTGDQDQQAGGYGATTIDFGAPGIDVYTASGSSGYGTTTGTSFSCPLTAGLIGLIYSAPCNSLTSTAYANPQLAADQVRMALMNGVDQVPSMNGISVTGGRINAHKSLQEIINNCSTTGCITPYNLAATAITDVQADLEWAGLSANQYHMRYREVGTTPWIDITTTNTTYQLTGLSACTDYEFQVQAECGSATDTSAYSQSYNFQTDGCCEPPAGLTLANITATSVDVSWPSVLAANSYNLRYKKQSAGSWTDISGVTSTYTLTGLDSCDAYEVQVQTVCQSGPTAYTASFDFNTVGCGSCQDLGYCASSGDDATAEWLESVEMGQINNISGSDGGYADYTNISTVVYRDSSYDITLTPGFSGQSYDEYFKVWIDYNQNGIFEDPSELAYDAGGVVSAATTGTITIPASAGDGATRMRVSMKYVNGFFDPDQPTACLDGFGYGEVEDYCLFIGNVGGGNSVAEINQNAALNVYPNPAGDQVTIEIDNFNAAQNPRFVLYNTIGKAVMNVPVTSQLQVLDLGEYSNGVYIYRVITNEQTNTGQGKLIINK